MSDRRQRVTTAQRAAVCGLVLIDVPYGLACTIVGVPYRRLHPLLGKDWWGRAGSKSKVWRGDRLAAVKSAYLDRSLPLKDIERAYGISRRWLQDIAAQHGWPRRQRGRGAQLPVALAKLPRETLRRYKKLQRIIGRSAAEQAVFGTAAI